MRDLISQRIRIFPDEPERLLGGVHHPAVLDHQLAQEHVVLERRVEVLKTGGATVNKGQQWLLSFRSYTGTAMSS